MKDIKSGGTGCFVSAESGTSIKRAIDSDNGKGTVSFRYSDGKGAVRCHPLNHEKLFRSEFIMDKAKLNLCWINFISKNGERFILEDNLYYFNSDKDVIWNSYWTDERKRNLNWLNIN